MNNIKENLKNSAYYLYSFFKWLFIAIAVGIVGGILGSIFHICINIVTNLRENDTRFIYLLPVGGLLIALMYRIFDKKGKIDTNRVIKSIRKEKNIPLVMVPLIFIGTLITHFFGGSAGREGAALQLGGSIGYNIGRVMRLKKSDMHIIVMSGMSAVFAALFGTPITAAVFSLEVTTVGVMYYVGLLPCLISSITAVQIAKFFNITPVHFEGINFGVLTFDSVFKVIVLASFCAVLSIIFCQSLKNGEHLMKKYIKNPFLRAFSGGVAIVLLTIFLGTFDYNGAGMNIISRAMSGYAKIEAPLLKIVFTVITIAAGFKGGEIVPTFFIGSTFGCAIAPFLGLEPAVGAAIGFIALFCGVVNCPVASLILSVEVFGIGGLLYFAIATSVSYMLSGYFGLYESQKIIYSKTEAEYIDVNTK